MHAAYITTGKIDCVVSQVVFQVDEEAVGGIK